MFCLTFRLTAIFSSVTQTQTRTQLARVWLEYESSKVKLSVVEYRFGMHNSHSTITHLSVRFSL